MPNDPRIARVCRQILLDPARDDKLDDWAATACMSRRTLTRLFRQETGMSLAAWRQHVRLLDESINNGQANCVDGSVLLASLLRKIGVEPILVMVPGHCYLAFYLDAEGKQIAALETTLLGSALEEAVKIKGLKDTVSDEWQQENSWKTFTAALAIGTQDLVKNDEKFKAADEADYQLISILAARKIGILPIAFQSGERLLAPSQSE
jgi:hypothetical protein